MMIKMIVGEIIVTVLLVFVPQTGTSSQNLVQIIVDSEMLLIYGDFNGHIGKAALGYEGLHGRYGFHKHNVDGERTLEFAVANNLVVGNLKLLKKDNHLFTMYQSGSSSGQVDYVLLQCNKFHLVKDIKIFPGEECITHHRLLICNSEHRN